MISEVLGACDVMRTTMKEFEEGVHRRFLFSALLRLRSGHVKIDRTSSPALGPKWPDELHCKVR